MTDQFVWYRAPNPPKHFCCLQPPLAGDQDLTTYSTVYIELNSNNVDSRLFSDLQRWLQSAKLLYFKSMSMQVIRGSVLEKMDFYKDILRNLPAFDFRPKMKWY